MADGAPALKEEVLLSLGLTPLFAGVAPADIRALTAGAEIVTHPHDHALYAEGDPCRHFFVVLDGHVELSAEVDGKRSVVEVARRGAVLGDAAAFGDGHYLMSARVLTGATLLAIPAETFRAQLEQHFDAMAHMLSGMSYRLRMLVRQVAELKLKTTAQRLGGFILSLTEAPEGRVELRFPYDKKLVADELGMKPESLSRALSKLARVGVEALPDNRVVVADIRALREFCAEDGTV